MRDKNSDTNFWISYSDLTAGLLFIFLAILLISHFSFSSQKSENDKVFEKLQYFLKLREKIAEDLKSNFIKEGIDVQIDPQTGILTIKETLLFDKDKADLKPEGADLLRKIIPVYSKTLFGRDEFKEWIKGIIIEGHASKEKEVRYLMDMKLSQDRAFAVLSFVFGPDFNDFPDLELLRELTTAQGRGFMSSLPPLPEETPDQLRKRNRRVEIKYLLDSDRMLEEVHKEMQNKKHEPEIPDHN